MWLLFFKRLLGCVLLTQFLGPFSFAWENHNDLTRFSLEFDRPDLRRELKYEPIEAFMPKADLAKMLFIHEDRVRWDWDPVQEKRSSTPLEILVYSSIEPDFGMDQNLTISKDQELLGGYTGPSSQAIRHTFFRSWTPRFWIESFHVPLHEMGQADQRAQVFFDLAIQAKRSGHLFWAYRFLGMGLHYVQDLTQPYHTSQFQSWRLLPFSFLLKGWTPFVAEATRLGGNFHLSFEQYAKTFCVPSRPERILRMFQSVDVDESLKSALNATTALSIRAGARLLANHSLRLVTPIVTAEIAAYGDLLFDPRMDIIPGFYDQASGTRAEKNDQASGTRAEKNDQASGTRAEKNDQSHKPKIDFDTLERDSARVAKLADLKRQIEYAMSNLAYTTRWYVDRFNSN